MSKYDDDQAKYNQWAIYFLILSVGYGMGLVNSAHSVESERIEIYNSLPVGCQKVLENKLAIENEVNADKSEYYSN